MLKVLIEESRTTFGLTSDFNVPYQTIASCIKSGNLEVLYPGEKSMLLHMEVVLKAYLITAADLSGDAASTEGSTGVATTIPPPPPLPP